MRLLNPAKLSIIIVSYNTKKFILKLLESINRATHFFGKPVEIIIVDNGSEDGTEKAIKDKDPKAVLIKNKENLGFARACNQGLKKARGSYLLLLNSDTLLEVDVLTKMVNYLDSHPDVGVVTGKIIFPDGKIDPACHRGFPTPWASITYFLGLERLLPKFPLFSGYHLRYKPEETIHEIDSPSGAFFLTRREVISTVGLLDEQFFMYGEDLDWAFRIKKAGWKIVYNPTSQITHFKKQSGIKSADPKVRVKTINAFYEAMKIFYRKHYQKKYPKLVKFIIFRVIDLKKYLTYLRLKIPWI